MTRIYWASLAVRALQTLEFGSVSTLSSLTCQVSCESLLVYLLTLGFMLLLLMLEKSFSRLGKILSETLSLTVKELARLRSEGQ